LIRGVFLVETGSLFAIALAEENRRFLEPIQKCEE
jgi:hypothetical protein